MCVRARALVDNRSSRGYGERDVYRLLRAGSAQFNAQSDFLHASLKLIECTRRLSAHAGALGQPLFELLYSRDFAI